MIAINSKKNVATVYLYNTSLYLPYAHSVLQLNKDHTNSFCITPIEIYCFSSPIQKFITKARYLVRVASINLFGLDYI